jgi:hypothetical protein
VFLFLLAAVSIAWVWWHWTPPPVEDQRKHDAVVAVSFYLALVEWSAQQQWIDRYRRCDPEPYDWYPLERVLQLLKYHVRCIVQSLLNFVLNLLSLSSPRDWFRLFTDETVRNGASAITSPYVASMQFAIDIAAELFVGEPVYVPLSKQSICYVYCGDFGDDVCEYN